MKTSRLISIGNCRMIRFDKFQKQDRIGQFHIENRPIDICPLAGKMTANKEAVVYK